MTLGIYNEVLRKAKNNWQSVFIGIDGDFIINVGFYNKNSILYYNKLGIYRLRIKIQI